MNPLEEKLKLLYTLAGVRGGSALFIPSQECVMSGISGLPSVTFSINGEWVVLTSGDDSVQALDRAIAILKNDLLFSSCVLQRMAAPDSPDTGAFRRSDFADFIKRD
jgi:hypothetical protein